MKFSFNWFRTKKREEELLDKEEELLDLRIRKEELIVDSLEREEQSRRDAKLPLYTILKFVNDVLTVVFTDGSMITKSSVTIDDFIAVKEALSTKEILEIMKGEEKEKKEDVLDNITKTDIDVVCHFPDFEVAEECIYMNGIKRSLPPLLVKRFGEILSKFDRAKAGWETEAMNDLEYSSLKKFWLKCCLNPNSQSAEDLYTFLSHHNMKIDRHGNFFAYRSVCKVNVGKETKLVKVISSAYNNVKAVWKKKAVNYRIEELNGEYSMHKVTAEPKGKIVGNLETLYLDLPNMTENRYTDMHTHKMDYRVGEIASIPRHECDDNNQVNCGAGLHCANREYNYNGFGDTPILVIVNPMDVVASPLNEVGKLRTSRFFFAMILDEEDGYILDEKEFDVTDLGDVFEEKCLANIEDHVHKSFAEEVKRHTFSIPEISDKDIESISDSLRKMNEIIKDRVVKQ